jgi:hypothetical protein
MAPLPNGLRHALTSRESPLPWPTPAGHGCQPPRKPPSNPGMVRGNGREVMIISLKERSIVSVLILDAMTSFLTNLILDNIWSHLWRLSNERKSPISHGPFPAKRYRRRGTLHNGASPEPAAARTDQSREPTSTTDPSRPQAPTAAKTALESQYGPWESKILVV